MDKSSFVGKKFCVLGDRDGIPGPAISECLKDFGGEVVFASTECFVWTAAGAMDMANQSRIKDAADKYGVENVVVVLGGAEAESSGLSAETVTAGDPTYAGPLANVDLGLRVYHIFELKDLIDPAVYDKELSMMEMVMDVEGNIQEVKGIREQYCKFTD